MIINTGCRTDIPAFYSKWFMDKIDKGYVYVRNPYYPLKVTKYSLDPDVVDCLLFCTKNPSPMIKYLDKLKKYNMLWHVTITPYGKNIEPNVPDKSKVTEDFKILSKKVGIDSIYLRYDPIFFGMGFDLKKHIEEFTNIVKSLKGYTKHCIISFLDMYGKVKKNAPYIRPPEMDEQIEIVKCFVNIAKENGIILHGCCENSYLSNFGLDSKGCLRKEFIEESIKEKLNVPSIKNKRQNCNCLLGVDIGEYNTCPHMCIYCYANLDKKIVIENMKKHDSKSPLLIGNFKLDDDINIAKQKSYKIKYEQLNLFE